MLKVALKLKYYLITTPFGDRFAVMVFRVCWWVGTVLVRIYPFPFIFKN